MVAPALEGILVAEVSREIRGRYCGRLFAELGANVVRIEEPGGIEDPDRPWLDAGKQSVVLDWRAAPGDVLLRQVLGRVDILIEDCDAAGALACFGEEPLRPFPRLVHISLTPFGLSGPWAERDGHDLIVSALSGMAVVNQVPGAPPMREPGPQTELVAALTGFVGALAALEERDRSGRGQRVEVSSLESMVNVLSPLVLQQSYQPGVGARRDFDFLFPCADGWMSLIILADPAWEATVTMLGLPVDPADERFATQATRRANFEAIREMLLPALAGRTRRELFEMLSAVRVVCGMVMKPEDLLVDPHLAARDAFVPVQGTGVRVPRVPIRMRGHALPARLPLPARGADAAAWLKSGGPG